MFWLWCIISNIVLSSLLALVAWVVQRWFRMPAIARLVWLLVLAKLVTPPLVSISVVDLPGTLACSLGICNCPEHEGTLTILIHTFVWVLLAVWVSGTVAAGWLAWRRWRCFRQLTAHAAPAPSEWQSLAESLSTELLIRCPEVLVLPGRLPPLVFAAWRRAKMLLPIALIGELDSSQKTVLLLHELAHLKRRDHLVRLLELLVGVIFWWLPIARAVGRPLRACEEKCSDAAVMTRLPHARRDYARLLLDVVDFAHPLPLQAAPQVAAMSPLASDLESRLRAILNANPPRRRRWLAMIVAGLACGILPCQLHCSFAGSNAALAEADQQKQNAVPTESSNAIHKAYLSPTACCPS